MRLTFVFLAAVVLVTSACEQKKRADVISVSSNDREMNAAIQEGRRTFDTFKDAYTQGNAGPGLIKVYFSESGGPGEGEHMWVQPTDLSKPQMHGILLDTPEWMRSVKSGQEVTFGLEDVSDWMLIRDGHAVGAHTVQLLRSRMSPAERKAHDSLYPFSFD